MDIVVKGRNVEVPDHYRVHVSDKLARMARYDRKVVRFEVELLHEPNRRQAKNCQRVEITGKGRGPVIRAEACAGDFYAALDCAVSKLENRLRRQHDRRKVHYGRRSPSSVAQATSRGSAGGSAGGSADVRGATGAGGSIAILEVPRRTDDDPGVPEVPEQRWDDGVRARRPGRIVREKEHSASPMSVDQALYEMELVGHDFYLFYDVDAACPSVVYRRKGFDYGVIRLAQ